MITSVQILVFKKGDVMPKLNKLIEAVPLILFILGLVAFVVAGFLFNMIIGTIVLAICLIISAWIVSPGVKP